jgi:hypothetical protein
VAFIAQVEKTTIKNMEAARNLVERYKEDW